MTYFFALLRKDKDSDYSVDFPDFPGCVTAGRTLQEATFMAQEALAGHVAVMIEHGEAVPEPTPLDAIKADPDNVDATPFLVPAPEAKIKKINISLPESELWAIDAHARRRKLSRSAFLLQAAQKEMKEGNRSA